MTRRRLSPAAALTCDRVRIPRPPAAIRSPTLCPRPRTAYLRAQPRSDYAGPPIGSADNPLPSVGIAWIDATA